MFVKVFVNDTMDSDLLCWRSDCLHLNFLKRLRYMVRLHPGVC